MSDPVHVTQSKEGFAAVHIEATTLNDAWFQLIWAIYDHGRRETVTRGSYEGDTRLEFDWVTCHIKYPGVRPLNIEMPESSTLPPPNDAEKVDEYFALYLMSGMKQPEEDYTYGERLVNYEWTVACMLPSLERYYRSSKIDQVKHVIDTYTKYGFRNNQMVLTIGQPSDLHLGDPPCLRHIDTRIQKESDGKYYLHFYPYFRSNDLWNGWPTNLGGIQLMKEYMAAELGVEDGQILYSSKGLHIYGHMEEIAELRLCRSE
jgi:thymidylate synthase